MNQEKKRVGVQVYKREFDWVVRRPDRARPTRTFGTKEEAEDFAGSYLKKGMDVIVFRANGAVDKVFRAVR